MVAAERGRLGRHGGPAGLRARHPDDALSDPHPDGNGRAAHGDRGPAAPRAAAQLDTEADQEADPQAATNNGGNNNGGNSGNNNGGGTKPPQLSNGGHAGGSQNNPPSGNTGSSGNNNTSNDNAPSTVVTQSTGGGTTGQADPPTVENTKPADKPDKPAKPTAPATTEAAVDTGGNQPPTAASTDDGSGAAQYDTYLSSSEPVETKSAPVWVVPGILLVLTSMLALLGGVLGRGNRGAPVAAPVPVKRTRRPEIDES